MDFLGMTEAVIDQMANASVTTGGDPVRGIFENGFRAFDLGGTAVESNTPELSVKSSDFPDIARGEEIEITHDSASTFDGTYVVRDVRPDVEGMTVLVLSESS